MKKYLLIFCVCFLTIVVSFPHSSYSFVTTDVGEGAKRTVGMVNDGHRSGMITLEKVGAILFGDQVGEGDKETQSFRTKIDGWKTDVAKELEETGNPMVQELANNSRLIAQLKTEIAGLEIERDAFLSMSSKYYDELDALYQEKKEAFLNNKQTLANQQRELTNHYNLVAKAKNEYEKAIENIQDEFEKQLEAEIRKESNLLNMATDDYEDAKSSIEKESHKEHKKLDEKISKYEYRKGVVEEELAEWEVKKEAAQKNGEDSSNIEMNITAKRQEIARLDQEIINVKENRENIKNKTVEKLNELTQGYEAEKQKIIGDFAEKKKEKSKELEKKQKEYEQKLKDKGINPEEVKNWVNGTNVNNYTNDILSGKIPGYKPEKDDPTKGNGDSSAEDSNPSKEEDDSNFLIKMHKDLSNTASNLQEEKKAFDQRVQNRVVYYDKAISDKKKTLLRVQAQLKEQLKNDMWAALGVEVDKPEDALEKSQNKNFIKPNLPETAENIDAIRRERFKERRNAYLSSYADAILLKNRVLPDFYNLENFARNTDSMDTISGVIGADTDIMVKTIELLMQYAEIIASQLRVETATEFGKLPSYKVKNPNKNIANFNLDDYIYSCEVEKEK